MGNIKKQKICFKCNGTGFIVENTASRICNKCHGTGEVSEYFKTITITIAKNNLNLEEI